jgi:hypothetical protein
VEFEHIPVELEGLFWNLKVEQNAVYRYLASLVKPFFGAEINLTPAISLFCLVISQITLARLRGAQSASL